MPKIKHLFEFIVNLPKIHIKKKKKHSSLFCFFFEIQNRACATDELLNDKTIALGCSLLNYSFEMKIIDDSVKKTDSGNCSCLI